MRLVSALMALLLVFAVIPTAWANSGSAALDVNHEVKDGKHLVTATIPGATQADGEWTLKGQTDIETKKESKSPSVTFELPASLTEQDGVLELTVTFKGKVNNGTEDQELSGNVSVTLDESKPGNDKGKDEQKGTNEDKKGNGDEQTGDDPGNYDIKVYQDLNDEGFILFKAEIENAKDIKGKWEFTIDGLNPVTSENGTAVFEELYEEGEYTLHVKFTGTVDGKEVTLEKDHDFAIPGMKITYTTENGKHVIKAELTYAKEAQGIWYIGVGHLEDEEAITETMSEPDYKGTSFTYTIDKLEPGTYDVVALFAGDVDGVPMGAGNTISIEVKDGGKTVVLPPKDGDGKDAKKPPIMPVKKSKEMMNEAKKGGKLPVTATNYPMGTLFGGLMLLIGLTLLKFRTVRG
ncbi:hypothetical protein JQC72_01610 [Polycladomyces sp. WAk]|uniref:Uncharacterized protein n=1 Tax=Polycladomyces zharkentensis TaxID=2807616 RepID=A0ABS2WFA1_9BACL|nr:hypothetical protein [Polycladomyces sp. WAk]MBN2908216.1 hypothetical protein [Polycladomyces sp. WAk]